MTPEGPDPGDEPPVDRPPDTPAESDAESAADQTRRDQNSAWDAFSLIAAGVAFWGGVGWLLSEWLDNRLFLMFGILLGAFGALYLVWVRYGKP
jgi:ATP synthase protein I